MTMKFYMTPGSCSTGIHILLEEVGLIFEAHLVNLMQGDQHKPDYVAMNPKSTIPTLLREDGTALTEFQTIAWWLAKAHPRRKLLPDALEAELQVLDMMNYVVNTLHGQGFTRIFTTDKYAQNTAEHEAIQSQGRDIIDNGFKIVNDRLSTRSSHYVVDQFSIADAALFYVEFWANRIHIDLPEHCEAHYQTMLKRPTVRQVLMEEGYASIFN
ncbi:glutathione S-transferase N-terminal domain-containing protein [Candidatus Albibeggiatoa sp. nov. NOAA]|uniref:glutathione S-transferase family protein n=1 Tax=Candidatus Albibeggiatoa sp. nov. NOAA TaxID=3162724 RepID=UPI0032FEFDC7|nr:glutathione S-transferase N-terminal domain-containing protein [Thiotrichaceae bacterium]